MQTAEETATRRPAAVYRLWGAEGILLYIGSAYDPEERAKDHKHTTWWPRVTRRTDEWHDSREAAYDAEGRAIAAESPAHNVAGTSVNTGPAERGRIQREACDARWRVALAEIRAGASVEGAQRAGGWAEVEYLEASGIMPKLAAKWRREMEETGGTWNSRNMGLPGVVNGRLTWEMRPSELAAASRAGLLPRSSAMPTAQRWERVQHLLDG
ncbi:hypothetical protein ACIQZB_00500 [Streptomyces sp. NPDC097727]|uniref:hypothetical protein n=1 Tax=Streptomyces sp. NPDC097727 TaxID=3366092 RepID=UPI0038082F9B